jgi:hypothetical protein
MELPALPSEFPGEARNRIVDAEIKATRVYAASTPMFRPFPAPLPSITGDWQLLHVYILPVFLAFAKEACTFGQHATWFSDQIDHIVREYLRRLMIAAQREYSGSDRRITEMISGGLLHTEVRREIEKSAEWIVYQDLLLGAGNPSNADAISITDSIKAQEKPREYREPNSDLLKSAVSLNRKQAAQAIGVSERTLDRLIGDGRLTPIGGGSRKRFKTKELLQFLNFRLQDKHDKSRQK